MLISLLFFLSTSRSEQTLILYEKFAIKELSYKDFAKEILQEGIPSQLEHTVNATTEEINVHELEVIFGETTEKKRLLWDKHLKM